MQNEKNNKSENKKNKYSCFWRFVKISYNKKIERQNKKIIIMPAVSIALQVGDKFYLQDLKALKRSKSNTKNIRIFERYDYIPADASKELIKYYLEHLKKRQKQLKTEYAN